MQVVARFCKKRRDVTRGALALGIEDLLPAHRGRLVEGARRRLWGGDRQLIEVEVGELRGHEVRLAPAVSRSSLRRDRILLFVVQPGVKERPRSMHLGNGDPGIPVRDGSKSGPGMEVDAGEAEGGWNESACLLPIGPERLAVLVELRVESARAPGAKRLLHGGNVNS